MKDYSFFMPGTNGKGVLLIHGLTGIPGEMKFVGKLLNKKGFTVYAPLLAGHGGTLEDLLKTNWHDWYGSAQQGFLKLKENAAQVYTVGICAGGALGMILAARRPLEVSGQSVYSLTFDYNGWNMPRGYYFSPLMPLASHIPLLRSLSFKERHPFGIKDDRIRKAIGGGDRGFMEGVLDYFPLRALSEMVKLNNELKKSVRNIKSPTLLIHAKNDDMSHPKNSTKFIKKLGANSRLELLEDSYHMIHIDKERNKVAELTADFFNSTS